MEVLHLKNQKIRSVHNGSLRKISTTCKGTVWQRLRQPQKPAAKYIPPEASVYILARIILILGFVKKYVAQ
jgi:hypothetical protein